MESKSAGLPEVLKAGSNELEIVDFRIFEDKDGEVYEWIFGVNVAKVREVLRLPKLTKVPNMPEVVEGMAEIRGKLIPVVSLCKWMGIEEPPERRKFLLHLEFLRENVGIIVHDAKRIRRITWSDIKKAPDILNDKLNGRITGVVHTEDGLLIILDFEGILSDMNLLVIFEKDEAKDIKSPKSLTVLVAEDSPVARKIISDILESAGHNVIKAEDGQAAWEILQHYLELAQKENKSITDYIQVLVTDIEMPRMDGFTLVKKIKETVGLMSLPVIVNTTLSDDANMDKAFKVGADDFLVKFDAKMLLDMIHKHGGVSGDSR